MQYAPLPSSGGWQVKNKEVLQSGTQKNFWVGKANFKKVDYFYQKDTPYKRKF